MLLNLNITVPKDAPSSTGLRAVAIMQTAHAMCAAFDQLSGGADRWAIQSSRIVPRDQAESIQAFCDAQDHKGRPRPEVALCFQSLLQLAIDDATDAIAERQAERRARALRANAARWGNMELTGRPVVPQAPVNADTGKFRMVRASDQADPRTCSDADGV